MSTEPPRWAAPALRAAAASNLAGAALLLARPPRDLPTAVAMLDVVWLPVFLRLVLPGLSRRTSAA